ncbi:MAG: FUSC family protein [Actinobacteria bacterium]|nr:FUSC family protein [Thermoleophilia bacterium]MCB9010859.1 FUSC family protein [Actinomycetota bacterium]
MDQQRRTERATAQLIDRAWYRGRSSVRARWDRLYGKSWHIGQAAIAAGLAWFIAADVLGHRQPFFAPIAAVVSLGTTYIQRLRRVAEVTAGVAIGVFVGDAFVQLVGTGAWQITLVVALAMSSAFLLDAGVLLVTQAAVQSIVVTVFVADGSGFARWTDAAIGGGVALVAAAVIPQAPLRRPRVQAGTAVRVIARILRGTAHGATTGDIEVAATVLHDARRVDSVVQELGLAAEEGRSALRASPFRRRYRTELESIGDSVEHIDRALRSARWLLRRVVAAAYHAERVPTEYPTLISDMAAATDRVADAFEGTGTWEQAREALRAVAAQTAHVPRTSLLSNEVILAQVRSTIVELMQTTGLDLDDAVSVLPRLPTRNLRSDAGGFSM